MGLIQELDHDQNELILDLVPLEVGEELTGLWKESHSPNHQEHQMLELNNKNEWVPDVAEKRLGVERSHRVCRLDSLGSAEGKHSKKAYESCCHWKWPCDADNDSVWKDDGSLVSWKLHCEAWQEGRDGQRKECRRRSQQNQHEVNGHP